MSLTLDDSAPKGWGNIARVVGRIIEIKTIVTMPPPHSGREACVAPKLHGFRFAPPVAMVQHPFGVGEGPKLWVKVRASTRTASLAGTASLDAPPTILKA